MQGFLNARAGDISGDIFLDGDIPGDIFGDGDFHAQDTIVCAAPVDSIRCGEPLPRKVGAPSVFRMAGTPPGSTCEG